MRSAKSRIAAVFKNASVDAIVVFNSDREDSNFTYLTRFKGGTFEYTPLIVEKGKMTLFASPLEYGIAKSERPMEMKVKLVEGDLEKALASALKGKKVGINGSFLSYRLYKLLERLKPKPRKIVDVSKAFALARLVKDEDEVSKIRTAARITKGAIESVKADLKVGMTELEVAKMIDMQMLKHGCENSFNSIVSFDSNTALPHHSPGSAKLLANSILLFDVGAKYHGYCGDITRTFMFKPNKKSEKFRRFSEIYSVVENAQKMALKAIREGAVASKPHKIAEDYINSYKNGIYKGLFIHSLGHSIGLEVHDGPGLSPSSKMKLKKNMVFSDEPGIYIEGFGGVRIEDDVLVGKGSSAFL